MVLTTSLPSCDKHFGCRRSRFRQIINQFMTIMFDIKDAYLEPCQTSKTGRFAKPINVFQLLSVHVKRSILDVWHVLNPSL